MAIDFESKLLAPAYRIYGQVAAFKSPIDGLAKTLVVIDDSVQVTTGSVAQVETTRPAFRARVSDLEALGLTARDMIDLCVTFKDRRFKIRNPIENSLDGAPGEILFLLLEA